MKVALLIATYNWPEALELVLKSVTSQTKQPNEVLIADDGSSKETKKVIEDIRAISTINITHIWHEDDGFRKTIILNKTIAKTNCDYIIEVDGDCILHPNFIEDHIRFSKPNVYLYGSRVTIKEDYLNELFSSKNCSFNLFSKGINKKTRALRIPLFSSFYSEKNELSRKLRGCNLSFWKKDFIAVNGYNEEMTGWGREDSELIVRMMNNGIKGRRIRYAGIVYHIWHKTLSKNSLNKNDLIQKEAISNDIKWCKEGVDKYL